VKVALVALIVGLAAVSAAGGGPARRVASSSGLIVFPVTWPVGLSDTGPATSVLCGADLKGHAYRLTGISPGTQAAEPTWSADGMRLAWAVASTSAGAPIVDVVLAPVRGRRLGVIEHAEWPAWGPSGSQIAFQSPPDLELGSSGGQPRQIFVSGLAGTDRRAIGAGHGPVVWSHDGSRLAYLTGSGITIAAADGSQSATILAGTTIHQFDWAPDDSAFAFVPGTTAPGLLEIVAADGSGRHVVLRRGVYASVAWSPDARQIAFESNAGVSVVSRDGSHLHLVYRGDVGTVFADGLDWQPVPHPELLRGLPPCEIVGDSTHHRLVGSRFADAIYGTNGNDTILGGAGNDVIFGGAGNDQITGGAGADEISAGPGNDVVNVRDGTRDVVTCGTGRDLVVADRKDRVGRDCERVERR